MAYIDYTLAWGKLIRQDEEPSDGYSLVWGEVKTYYTVAPAGQTLSRDAAWAISTRGLHPTAWAIKTDIAKDTAWLVKIAQDNPVAWSIL
ncbi:MAG: hypothetical protein DRP09_19140, partial [Candidatus Thorarchaeota archaeon]